MGCCLIAGILAASPRLVLFGMWIFGYLSQASIGWIWGFRDTITCNNRIENNLIHDIGAGILSDMGGIYTLGIQPGTVVA